MHSLSENARASVEQNRSSSRPSFSRLLASFSLPTAHYSSDRIAIPTADTMKKFLGKKGSKAPDGRQPGSLDFGGPVLPLGVLQSNSESTLGSTGTCHKADSLPSVVRLPFEPFSGSRQAYASPRHPCAFPDPHNRPRATHSSSTVLIGVYAPRCRFSPSASRWSGHVAASLFQ